MLFSLCFTYSPQLPVCLSRIVTWDRKPSSSGWQYGQSEEDMEQTQAPCLEGWLERPLMLSSHYEDLKALLCSMYKTCACTYTHSAQSSCRPLAPWCCLWKVETSQEFGLYFLLPFWLWFCGDEGEDLPLSCSPVDAAFTRNLTVAVFVTRTNKNASSFPVDFPEQLTSKLNLKPRIPQMHPEEQLDACNKNRKVIVEGYAGVSDAAQSRKWKTWSRGQSKSR